MSITVEPILLGYMFCLFLTFPIEQQLIYHKVCAQHFNKTYCNTLYHSKDKNYRVDQNFIQKQTALWGIYLDVARTLPSIIATIFYGAWSDRIGRKTIMILPIIGDFLGAVANVLNSYFFYAPISYLLIGSIITSLFGSFASMLLATFSYISDVSSEESRTVRVTILESMIYLGSVLSNISGGWLLQLTGFRYVFLLNCVIFILLMVYWFFLKESYFPDSNESTSKLKDLINFKRAQEALHVFTVKRRERFRITLYLLLVCFFVLVLFFVGINAISVLYVLHQPFNLPPSKIGYFLAEANAAKFLGAMFINFVLIHKFKWNDYSIILLSSIMYCGYTISLAVSKTEVQIYIAAFWCLGLGVGISAIRAGISKMVSSEEQGKIFSAVASIEVFVAGVASAGFSAVYKKTVDISPNLSFYVMAGLTVIPISLSLLLKLIGQKKSYEELVGETVEPDLSTNANEVYSASPDKVI